VRYCAQAGPGPAAALAVTADAALQEGPGPDAGSGIMGRHVTAVCRQISGAPAPARRAHVALHLGLDF
jgi:hypothetical protein